MDRKTLPAREERAASPADDRGFGLDHVGRAIEGLRFGEVRVIIQDGVIVQIERVEKQRIR